MHRVHLPCKKTFLVGLACLGFLLSGCSSSEKKEGEDAKFLFESAKRFADASRHDLAIEKFGEVKNKFPYSKYAVQAELAIADVYFKDESWVESQAAYTLFRELHPKHEKIEYVLFQIGMSYYNQLPSTMDRDLTVAKPAIKAFDELKREFPRSSYNKEADEKKRAALRLLMEKEIYIADFYFVRSKWKSAIDRYTDFLAINPFEDLIPHALARAKIAADRLQDRAISEKVNGLLKNTPISSSEFSKAEGEIL